jgi:hypothetical protein
MSVSTATKWSTTIHNSSHFMRREEKRREEKRREEKRRNFLGCESV